MRIASCLTAIALVAPLAAQNIIVANGNVTYTMFAPIATQADSPSANFTTNAAADTDVLFEDGWYYRIAGDAANNALKADGTLTITNGTTHSDADWTNVDNRGLIAINLDVDAVSTGATTGTVIHRLIVTNISANPVTVTMSRYIDMDVVSTSNSVTGAPNRHAITGGSETYEFFGAAADNWCVAAFSGTECGLVGGTNLDGSAPPFGPGDYSGAMQWTFEDIPPNTTVDRVITSAISGNSQSCAWGYDVYGENSPVSSGTITTEPDYRFPPVIGAATAATGIYRNWPAGADMLWCKGVQRISVDIGNLGVKLQVDPLVCGQLTGVPSAFAFVFNNFVPNNPALCGLAVHFQLFALDRAAANGVGGNPKPSTWVIGQTGQ